MAQISTTRSNLEAVVKGNGEPILTIHGAFWGEAFGPLLDESPIGNEYRCIRYWRHGYRHSSSPNGQPYSVDNVVQDAVDVLSDHGHDRAHVVAHSLGGVYALHMALSRPESVQTLTLIEPIVPTPEYAEWGGSFRERVQEAAQNGDFDSALDVLLSAIHGGGDYRQVMDPILPADWWDQCKKDLPSLLMTELPASREWRFGPEEASQITCPVLLIRGDKSVPMWVANHNHLLSWLPNAEEQIVSGAGHFELMAQPGETARSLAGFLKKHPIETVKA